MHRFHLPSSQCHGATLLLTGREAHHARQVVRVRPGERVAVLDGAGREFLCDVESCDRDQVQLTVRETHSHPPLPCRVTLLQAVPKGKIIEAIIQKATELGASRIVPVLSERVVAQLDEQDAVHKTARWQWVALEAIKQSGAPWLPLVEPPVTPSQFLARHEEFELPLIASLLGGSRSPREYFGAFHAQHGRGPKSACVWVGPEGDFTPAETDAIKGQGALPITLGPLVLRAETAAVYCLSILNYELQSPSPYPRD
jgi:16S rRNA (uracil1498-N3)-methyltransferase